MANLQGLPEEVRRSLQGAFAEMDKQGIPYRLNSAYRTRQQQERLYERRRRGLNPYPVAKPGTSEHEHGRAVDLGIEKQYRDRANAILAKHKFRWAGPKDEVHYSFGGAGKAEQIAKGADTRLAAARTQGAKQDREFQRVANQITASVDPASLVDPVAAKYLPAQGAPDQQYVDPVAAKYMQGGGLPSPTPQALTQPGARPEDSGGILQNTRDYWTDWATQTFSPSSGLNLYERFGYALKPLGDTASMVTGGALDKVMQKTWNPLHAGAKQLLKTGQMTLQEILEKNITRWDNRYLLGKADKIDWDIERGVASVDDLAWYNQNRFQIENARRPIVTPRGVPVSPEVIAQKNKVWPSVVRAFEGKIDPTLGRGGLFSAATGIDETSPQWAQFVGGLADIYSEAWTGGKAAQALKPVARGVKAGSAKIIDPAMRYAWAKVGNKPGFRQAAQYGQQVLNAAEDFRRGVRTYTTETAPVRAAQARLSRVHNMITGYSRKLAKAGTAIHGNVLEGTPWYRPELAQRMVGNIVDQLTFLYAEAGGAGSFFNEAEVLQLAAKRGIDPRVIVQIGDEAKQLNLDAGQHLVKAGMLTEEAFAANAGEYARRLYNIFDMDADEAALLAQQMAAQGMQKSETFALVQNIAANGRGSGRFRRTEGLDPTKVVRQRDLETPEERIVHLPDLSYVRSSSRSVVGQFRAAAQKRILDQVADKNLGMSLGAKLASDVWNRGDIMKQPRFQSELIKLKAKVKDIETKVKAPKTGLDAKTRELVSARTKSETEVRHYGQRKVQHQVSEPQEPVAPTQPTAPHPRFLAGPGITKAGKVSRAGAKRAATAVSQGKYAKDLQQYARDLSNWQKKHSAWQKSSKQIDEQFEVAKARLDKARIEEDSHIQAVDRMRIESERLTRRRELLEGKRPPALEDATDALTKALERVDPNGTFQMGPNEAAYWQQKWLDHWVNFNDDIFADLPPTGLPRIPAGTDPKILEAMGENNPLIAVALNKGLSAGADEISAAEAISRGWTHWGDDYGPMANRYASGALKRFLDDALSPERFMGGAKGPAATFAKLFGENIRTLKLYTNPLTHLSIYVQSYFEGMATVADAGKVFNPVSYKAGMKEWGEYVKGRGPETPTVRAILDAGIDMGGSPRTGVDPTIANPGIPNSRWVGGQIKDFGKQQFVDVQVFPKAGVVRTLIDQGVDPRAAAQWAEKGYGGAGIVQGGIETPGILQAAEMLNRYGVAMFTSYPLHSANRIMQMMATHPEIAVQYPVFRQYLLEQADPEMQEQARQGRLQAMELPIPFGLLRNPDNTQAVMNVANIVPHGGAFGDFNPPNLLTSFHRWQEEVTKGARRGLNPVDEGTRTGASFWRSQAPGSIAKLMLLDMATKGQEPTPYATQPQTVPQALGAMVGLPVRDTTTVIERMLESDKAIPKPARWKYMLDLEARMMQGYEVGKDFTNHPNVKNLDPGGLQMSAAAAKAEMRRLLTDSSIDDKRAPAMIENQMAWIQAHMTNAQKQGVRLMILEEAARMNALQGEP